MRRGDGVLGCCLICRLLCLRCVARDAAAVDVRLQTLQLHSFAAVAMAWVLVCGQISRCTFCPVIGLARLALAPEASSGGLLNLHSTVELGGFVR